MTKRRILGGPTPTKAPIPGFPASSSAVVMPCAAFLRPKAVTAHYGLSRSFIYRILAEGKITAVKAGRAVLIDGESLRTYLASLPPAVFKGRAP